MVNMNPNIFNLELFDIKKLSFQEKLYWFRTSIEKKRISWEKGADHLKLDRSNILMCSLMQYKKVNMYKEVKI